MEDDDELCGKVLSNPFITRNHPPDAGVIVAGEVHVVDAEAKRRTAWRQVSLTSGGAWWVDAATGERYRRDRVKHWSPL